MPSALAGKRWQRVHGDSSRRQTGDKADQALAECCRMDKNLVLDFDQSASNQFLASQTDFLSNERNLEFMEMRGDRRDGQSESLTSAGVDLWERGQDVPVNRGERFNVASQLFIGRHDTSS